MKDTTITAEYLRRAEAGAYLRAKYGFGSRATLAKLTLLGCGPEACFAGSIPLYTIAGLDAWAAAQMTAKPGAAIVRTVAA
jgi:hypothetical protein